ncbi:uncharacterized protein LOC130665352 [Microplitis mediator]|uniref:uncharacterized protein LOC130665352 n=1 Tax=Microplitis mediator TaxID=375433 RepID=UPI002552361A|nr:uncharacterized protein LOC130665352 [Microplitis mediator]
MIFTLQLIIPIVLFIIETVDEKKLKLNIFTHNISTIFINSSIGQYVGVLIFLNKRFEIINYLIIKFPTFNDNNNPCEIMMTNGFRNSLSKMELKFIRGNYYNYYKITEAVKKFYSPLILVVVVHWSLSLAYTSYVMLRYIIYDKDVTLMKYVIEILWILRTLFPFALLTGNVTAINNQIKNTPLLIHSIMATYPMSTTMKDEFKLFSMGLLHRNFKFTACGLFYIDNRLLSAIITTTITNMAILLQLNHT